MGRRESALGLGKQVTGELTDQGRCRRRFLGPKREKGGGLQEINNLYWSSDCVVLLSFFVLPSPSVGATRCHLTVNCLCLRPKDAPLAAFLGKTTIKRYQRVNSPYATTRPFASHQTTQCLCLETIWSKYRSHQVRLLIYRTTFSPIAFCRIRKPMLIEISGFPRRGSSRTRC